MADRHGPFEAEGFRRLLEWLSPEPNHAGEAYERIRQRLLRFFEWRRQSEAEELVDRTIDRVTGKLLQGEVRPGSDPLGFFYGVARNILKEHSGGQARRRSASFEQVARETGFAFEPEEGLEQRITCLERCLSRLSPRDRELILAYYQGTKREKIESRKALADRLRIPMNALWIRSHRLRLKLESCIETCVRRSTAGKRIGEDSR